MSDSTFVCSNNFNGKIFIFHYLGFEIARSLAKHGCQVILACRNVEKGEVACQKIRQEKVDDFINLTTVDC